MASISPVADVRPNAILATPFPFKASGGARPSRLIPLPAPLKSITVAGAAAVGAETAVLAPS